MENLAVIDTANDVPTKKYIDDLDALDVKKSGDTMTGALQTDSLIRAKTHTVSASLFASGSVAGAFLLEIPSTFGDDFMHIVIHGFEYASDTSVWTLIIGGYVYSGGWYNHSAILIGKGVRMTDLSNIKLLMSTTPHWGILIGNTTSTWSYPNLSVEVYHGGSMNKAVWATAWPLSLVTSIPGGTWTYQIPISSVRRAIMSDGDTMTGPLNIGAALTVDYPWANLSVITRQASTDSTIAIRSDREAHLTFAKADGTTQWILSEEQPNRLALYRYSDTGAYVGEVLLFNRSTGLGTVAGDPTAPTGIATKNYVDSAAEVYVGTNEPTNPKVQLWVKTTP